MLGLPVLLMGLSMVCFIIANLIFHLTPESRTHSPIGAITFSILLCYVGFKWMQGEIVGNGGGGISHAPGLPVRSDDDWDDKEHRGFGYKTGWIAVRGNDVQRVITALGLTQQKDASWNDALRTIYDAGREVALLPPIDGWVLIGNEQLPSDGSPDGFERLFSMLTRLSRTFGEAHAFFNFRINDYHYWIRAVDDEIARAFAYAGDSGELLLNIGPLTEVEAGILTGTPEEDWSATEADVMKVAGAWSVNPTILDDRADVSGNCVIATAPFLK